MKWIMMIYGSLWKENKEIDKKNENINSKNSESINHIIKNKNENINSKNSESTNVFEDENTNIRDIDFENNCICDFMSNF